MGISHLMIENKELEELEEQRTLLPCKVHIRKLDEKQKWASDPGTQICYTGFSSRAFTNCTKMPKLYLVVLNKTHLIVLSLNALPETI